MSFSSMKQYERYDKVHLTVWRLVVRTYFLGAKKKFEQQYIAQWEIYCTVSVVYLVVTEFSTLIALG